METSTLVSRFADALQADEYRVQIATKKEGLKPRNIFYTPEQLQKAVGFLRNRNAIGYDIYIRPVGWQYVLLDDLKREVLEELATFKPAVLVETSPDNFQAWLIFPDVPATRQDALTVCRELAERFKADPGAAEPDHVGRLPGYTNRKPKYRKPDGNFPFVRLCGAEHRLTTYTPLYTAPAGGAACGKPPTVKREKDVNNSDQSRADFGNVCRLIREGKSDSEIAVWLLNNSPRINERKRNVQDYIERTTRKAHLDLEKQKSERI
jgi:hypothetical protein